MPIEEPPADSGRLLIFVLPRSLTGWRIECDSFRDQAGKILLLVDYDHEFVGEVAESVGAESLLGPMDILGDDDIDPIINHALLWRRQFAQAMQDPQVRLAAGARE